MPPKQLPESQNVAYQEHGDNSKANRGEATKGKKGAGKAIDEEPPASFRKASQPTITAPVPLKESSGQIQWIARQHPKSCIPSALSVGLNGLNLEMARQHLKICISSALCQTQPGDGFV
ncbi:hypothetical protein FQN57_001481 [Myotisia sp. PD_48]|nr:hypothetical protein FQN57_001481 [Myotisia sp. PD_48]